MGLRTEVLQELHSQEPLKALTKVLERAAGQEHSPHLPLVTTAERKPIVLNPAGMPLLQAQRRPRRYLVLFVQSRWQRRPD